MTQSHSDITQETQKQKSLEPDALKQRLSALSVQQRSTLAKKLQNRAEASSSSASASQQLVAYVLPAEPTVAIDPSEIKAALKEQLPAYMMVSALVPLADFPRTANGKIDVNALPAPASPVNTQTVSPPTTPEEKTLADIWRAVLGQPTVGIHDNFFELGGDSILSIQIVSKAREAGLRLAPNQLFEQPTVAELAAAVNAVPAVRAAQSVVSGPVPLTPIQRWFVEQKMAVPYHWHQARLFQLSADADIERVKSAIAMLWQHHDALRLRFTPEGQQTNADIEPAPTCLEIDISALDAAGQSAAIARHGSELHANLRSPDTPLMQAAYFNRGKAQSNWLLLSLHHWIVDTVSWQIIQNDLEKLLGATDPQAQSLPEKTTSFKQWAETLLAQANSRQAEASFWYEQVESSAIEIPGATAKTTPTESTTGEVVTALSEEHTQLLLQSVPAAYNTQINDVLLTALTKTLLQWVNKTAGSVLIALEAHGREAIAESVDLSRTVGWCTTTYPVRLSIEEAPNWGVALKAVKEQLRQVPDRGIGYGLLRYLTTGDETQAMRQRLAQAASPSVLFNYLGQYSLGQYSKGDGVAENAALKLLPDVDVGVLRSPLNKRDYLLEINAVVSRGQLQCSWRYDETLYSAETIAHLAYQYLEALTALIAHCTGTEETGFTPSDFPDAGLTQAELDAFIAQLIDSSAVSAKQQVASIYPLASLQQAFLWHSLQTSAAAGLLHMRCTLHGEVDTTLFQRAWNTAVAGHPVLRTSVHWEGVKRPLQVVAQQVNLPVAVLDWRDNVSVERQIEDFLQEDSDRSFILTQAPISRLTLIRTAQTTYEFIWTCHHLLLDGWSGALVLNQVMESYEALRQGKVLSPAATPTYQTYIRWQQQQDAAAAKAFWQKTLRGFATPTPLPFVDTSVDLPETERQAEAAVVLTVEETAAVNAFLRSHRLTLNTFMQGLWALTLNGYSQSSDVLFGATVSGRQGDLAGVASTVGLLINVLPIRMKISASMSALDWLQSWQQQQAEMTPYAHASLTDIQAWCELSGRLSGRPSGRLFDSLLVIENYPMSLQADAASVRLENMRSGVVSTYGLTVLVKPGDALTLSIASAYAARSDIQDVLQQFHQLLTAIVTTPTASVEEAVAAGDFSAISSRSATLLASPSGVDVHADYLPDLSREALADSFTAPRNSLELRLLKIWSAVLGPASERATEARAASQLTVEDSFFDWGGNSMQAVQLFNRMQTELDCTLPIATLFQAPSVRQFAALLAKSKAEVDGGSAAIQWSSLVPVQPSGTERPFFFHGGSADALTWARFSQLLGANQPFYAFQRPDLDGRDSLPLTVEALAANCIAELRNVQPEGPYILGGHCFGGAVAFEMAQQLQAQGQAVASVILIDAYRPEVLPKTRRIQLQTQLNLGIFWLRKNYYYYGNKENISRLPSRLWQRIRPAKGRSTLAAEKPAVVEISMPSETSSEAFSGAFSEANSEQPDEMSYEMRYERAIAANEIAVAQYQAQPYSGDLKLFRARVQMLEWYFGLMLGWNSVVNGKLSASVIPGFFGNLFNQRALPTLTAQVKKHLNTLKSSL